MMRLLFCVLLTVFSITTASAATHAKWPGPFPVTLVKVLDGDTVTVAARGACPYGCSADEAGRLVISIRLAGIDAAEIHGCRTAVTNSCAVCPQEMLAAKTARDRVVQLTGSAPLRAVALKPDKYRGRVVGDLQVFSAGQWRSVSATLLAERLVVPYDGGRKVKEWCK